jgi:hypothetical protein
MPEASDATIQPYAVLNGEIAYGTSGKIVGEAPLVVEEFKPLDTLSMPAKGVWDAIVYGDGKFVTVEYGTAIGAYSTDGVTWTQSQLPSAASWNYLAYGNGIFVAFGYNSDKFIHSTDGITWTEGTLPVSGEWHDVKYGNNVFVAIANNSDVTLYSYDGISWTPNTMPSSQKWYSLAYGNGRFVAVTHDKYAARSFDGIVWEQTEMSFGSWHSVTYGDGKFIAASQYYENIAYSTDGMTWNNVPCEYSTVYLTIAYGAGKFIATRTVQSTALYYSYDGLTWYDTYNCPIYKIVGDELYLSADGCATKRVHIDGGHIVLSDVVE